MGGNTFTDEDEMEDTPRSITLPVLYEQQKGFRREMLGSIRRIEEVNDARYKAQQAEIETVRGLTVIRDDRIAVVESGLATLLTKIEPMADYIAAQQKEDMDRKRWRDRIFKLVFGSGTLSLGLALLEIYKTFFK